MVPDVSWIALVVREVNVIRWPENASVDLDGLVPNAERVSLWHHWHSSLNQNDRPLKTKAEHAECEYTIPRILASDIGHHIKKYLAPV